MTTRAILLVLLSTVTIMANVPSIEPEKTVNPATGEMGWSLSLGSVGGPGVSDFPVSLNYQAGIKLHQPASPAGLGFSVSPGGISKKVVFVEDDSQGKTYEELIQSSSQCQVHGWGKVLNIIITVLAIVVAVVCTIFGAYDSLAFAASLVTAIWSISSNILSTLLLVVLTPGDYLAGGDHVPQYEHTNGHGVDFFADATGSDCDLPDIYFVSTPYFSGHFSWTGRDPDNAHFTLLQRYGSTGPAEESQNVIIKQMPDNSFFVQPLMAHVSFSRSGVPLSIPRKHTADANWKIATVAGMVPLGIPLI